MPLARVGLSLKQSPPSSKRPASLRSRRESTDMWKQRMCFALGFVTVLAGCAADRIGAPAKSIGSSVTTFQGYLSTFQDSLADEQDFERATIAITTAERDLDVAWTKQMQVEWMIASAKRGSDIFTMLQSQ